MEPNCFGIIKGEQPLVCNGDDRGQWPKQGTIFGAAVCKTQGPHQGPKRMQGTARGENQILWFSLSHHDEEPPPQGKPAEGVLSLNTKSNGLSGR